MSPSTDSVPTGAIELAPPPWNTKATMYLIPFWTPSSVANNLPAKAFHPLELSSSFASAAESGKALGGLSMVQLIRYHETPVGPYDEMILCPGSFEYPHVDPKTDKRTTKKAMRITRIYVSQKYTTWNGRKLWNLPKHLAAFQWVDRPDGTTTIKVYPHDYSPDGRPYDPSESAPSTAPFFQATIKPIPFLPSFPFSSSLLKTIGLDYTVVQPPLPQGQTADGELISTKQWVKMGNFVQYAKQTSIGWADLSQKSSNDTALDEYENFWPGLGRWHLAMKLDKGNADFGDGLTWTPTHAE